MERLGEILRNFFCWIYCVITVPLFGSLVLVIRKHFWARVWCKGLLKVLGVEIKVYKEVDLPKGIYIFMANHQSQLDIPVLEKVLEDYNIRFLAKKSLFNIPFFGWGLKVLGYVPVEREDPKEGFKSILACVEKIKEGVSLVVFPEGTRSKDGEVLPFKLGGFLIPIKAQAKVIPVAIWGTKEVLPKGSLWLRVGRKRRIGVYLGEPIDTTGLTLRDKHLLSQKVREAILQGIERLKKEVE
ncbi:1-acyl-sn-glycerol-3-phosphate acyltransferase [Thermodesulfobacterium sp. TA1]|uniref:lysophospholipid acyltransferase family protein n=1 Tax=Thermodesulfobacterium sp. TA1 TaxID=2234087 RepID=UPI00143D0E4C|nr:lysophospholipid acyltransferase family protein [Thermodesulfobacterium sp. TA1]